MSGIKGANFRLAAAGVLAFASAGQAASAADAPIALDEIAVTVEKRASTVQETPILIVAYSGDALADIGVGVESATIGSDPGVATQREDAYVARSSVAVFDFFDRSSAARAA